MAEELELALIFVAVIIGVISAAYFYQSSSIFTETLKKPLKLIGGGMILIAVGVLMAAFISFESNRGLNVYFYGYPMSIMFYVLYIAGSIMIALGARRFTRKAKPSGAAV